MKATAVLVSRKAASTRIKVAKSPITKVPTSIAKAPITAVAKAPITAVAKAPIPRALREQVWITYAGRRFDKKCLVPWCSNNMTVFDFHVGHDIPESIGGATEIKNLRPICARCNLSMGDRYSIQEWGRLSEVPWWCRWRWGFRW